MSGIVGIVNLDGRPVDGRLLGQMTDAMVARGPDDLAVWLDGPVGFGHTLLHTADDADRHRQPLSLDGDVWITADARVDGRRELIDKLGSRASAGPVRGPTLRDASDAELILRAYHAWGEQSVEHLLGDFAFAIWDERNHRLFCARDHFGVKPFYYACVRHSIIFGNTLDAIRLHPAVGDRLNELAIADFLVFGFNQDPTTTSFADVRRLAPAHRLTCGPESAAPRAERYWTLPADGRIRYRRSNDYVDHFSHLLRTAVSDRLRTDRVGVWMSGGLDSTSIAAAARQLLSERTTAFDLRAYTVVYDQLIPDEERYYSRVAAEALGIETSYFVADSYGPLDGWDRVCPGAPEPTDDPFVRIRIDQLKQAASRNRVLLCGEGSDEVLWRSYVVDLLGKMRLQELGAGVARSLLFHRQRPGVGLRARLKRRLGDRSDRSPYPAWLNRTFADRLDLRARWERLTAPASMEGHPLRPEAFRRLAMAIWPSYLESSDPGVTGIPVEVRYPFLDVRLVGYVLAIPPIPWCVDKQLLRMAMRGALPDPIRLRPKTPLAGDQLGAHLLRPDVRWIDRFEPTPELARYVDRAAVPRLSRGCDASDPWLNLRPLCLDYWLRRTHAVTRIEEESPDDDQVSDVQRRWFWQEGVREPTARGLRRHP